MDSYRKGKDFHVRTSEVGFYNGINLLDVNAECVGDH